MNEPTASRLPREVVGWIRVYVGGLPWRLVNQVLGVNRRDGKLSPRVVLARGGGRDDPWEFAAMLRGSGVYTEVRHGDGSGGGGGGELTDVITLTVDGQGLVHGAADRSVAAVQVELAGATPVRLPLRGRGFPARFFVGAFPMRGDGRPVAVNARDEAGELLKHVPLPPVPAA